jgi:hypothetical protein
VRLKYSDDQKPHLFCQKNAAGWTSEGDQGGRTSLFTFLHLLDFNAKKHFDFAFLLLHFCFCIFAFAFLLFGTRATPVCE